MRSHVSHVGHLSPSPVVPIWSVWVLDVVRTLHVQLGVVWVVDVELDLPLKGTYVLSVHLEGEGPEDSLPKKSGLTILETDVVFIVWAVRGSVLVEAGDVEPIADDHRSEQERPALEPTLRVDVIQSPIRVSLQWPLCWETVRGILLGQYTEGVHYIGDLSRHSSQDSLLPVPEPSVEDSLLESPELVLVFA